MRIAFISLLALIAAVSAVSTVDVSAVPTTMTAANLIDRMTLINNINDFYRSDADGNSIYATMRVTLIDPTKILGLALDAFGVNATTGSRVAFGPILTFYSDSGFSYLKLTYTATMLNSAYGCDVMPAVAGYVGRVCSLSVDFRAKDQATSLLTINFKLGLMIQSTSQAVVAMSTIKQLKNGANLYVSTSYTSVLAIYDATCTNLATQSSYTYGDRICLKLTSPTGGSIVNSYIFGMVSLTMSYTTGSSTTTVDLLPMAYSVSNVTGVAQAAIGLPAVGSLTFTATVVLNNASRRRLRILETIVPGTTALAGSTTITVKDAPVPTSSASVTSVCGSFLAILLAFLILI